MIGKSADAHYTAMKPGGKVTVTLHLITVDLDDTLWDNRPVLGRAEQAAWQWLASHAPGVAMAAPVEQLRQQRLALMQEQPQQAHRVSWLRREVVRRNALAQGVGTAEADQLAEGAFAAFLAERSRVAPFPEAMHVLAQLRRHCLLAALTNGNTDLNQAGLDSCFDFVLSAEDPAIDAAKPHPRMFEVALGHADCEPIHALHIGDHPRCDIAGAQAAGFRTLWFNPANTPWPEPDFQPQYQFNHWREALPLLRQQGLLPD